MAVSQENINRWIEQADIDYIGYFVKSWIPFNAWYNYHYHNLNSEREKISSVKNEPNPIRNSIHSYMELQGQEHLEFRSYLSLLYNSLNQTVISGRDGRITMDKSLNHRNPVYKIDNISFGHDKYFLFRTDGNRPGDVTSMKVIIKKKSDNSAVLNYEHTAYDRDHFLSYDNLLGLSPSRRTQARFFFLQLDPISTTTLIENNLDEEPKNYYECDSYNFRRDTTFPNCYSIHICRSLIETLYQLRNVLFHGELVPNKEAQKVYKEAYLLLHMLLQKIK